MKLRKYTLEDLKSAIDSSFSARQVLEKLNVKAAGGNYETFHKAVKYFGLDISHFKGQGWNRGDKSGILKKYRKKYSMEEILVENSNYQSFKLKNRLYQEGYKDKKCECCGIAEWLDKPLSLELDHINGNKRDNRLENLRILCPNCHSQTDTWRGKNKS
jgi:hypothetical protein